MNLKVKGVKILLNATSLGRLLHAPTIGADRLDDECSGLRTILERQDVMAFEEILESHLSVEIRLLHHMTTRIFIPRVGCFDFIIERDVTIMHHIIKEISFNLLALMIKIMQDITSRAKPTLPYGMFLTLVFKEFGVNLDGECSKKLQHFDTYNDRSLGRMGYIMIDGHWIQKGGKREEVEGDRDRERAEPEKQREQALCTSTAQPTQPGYSAS